jgi:serine/threonine protein kinase/tetratricopeptide (TPR) repeat protein
MTDAERHLMTLFAEALEFASPVERAAYVDRACGDDHAARQQMESLLQAHAQVGRFLEPQASAPGAPTAAKDRSRPTASDAGGESPVAVLANYKLLEPIGEGGMGTVWMAQQTEPVRRVVALKLIKAGMDTKQVIARFEAERQALALMDHPNIAKVLDAGTSNGEPGGVSPGRPYFVMDLVKGVPITRYCDEHRLTPKQRLELFIPVCQAVQHAHQKGIIHRDLKPSNVLVALYDGKPVPKVIDFGVAKAAGQPLTEQTLVTGFGAIVGTLEYMSPEQAEINQLDIDTRSDIYSLGVLLYELLTGSPPFTRTETEAVGLLETLRLIREQDPPRPSTRLSTAEGLPTLAVNRGTEPAKLTKLVRGELDWIVMKALEKDRNRRYETANDFALDVQRYLADEPVMACPPSAFCRLGKFARRNRAGFAIATLAGLAVLAAVVGLAVSNVLIKHEKTQKETALQEAEANLLLARQAVDDIYKPVADQLAVVPHMQPYQRDVLQKTLRFYQEFAKRKSNDPAILLDTAWTSLLVVEIKRNLGERGPHEQDCREVIAKVEALGSDSPSAPKRRLILAAAHSSLGAILVAAGRCSEAEKSFRQALALYGDLVAEYGDEPDYRRRLAGAHSALGVSLQSDQAREAEKRHREAIRICHELLAASPAEPFNRGHLVQSYYHLGFLLAHRERLPEAEGALRQAIDTYGPARQQLDRSSYRHLLPSAQHELGRVLARRQRTEEAEKAFREAVARSETLVAQFPAISQYRWSLLAYSRALSSFLVSTGRPDEAAPFSRMVLDLTEKLLADQADETQSKGEVIAQHLGLGMELRDAGELQRAEKWYRKALELAKEWAAESSADLSAQYQLAEAHFGLGTVLIRARRFQEAADAHREQLAICDKLAAAHPDDPDYRYHQARAGNFLGIALRYMPKEADAAIRLHRNAIALCDRLVAKFPDQPRYRQQLVRSHYALGLALGMTQRWTDMEAAFRKALAEWKAPVDSIPEHGPLFASVQNDLAWLLVACPDEMIRNAKEAVEFAKKAVEADPKPTYWNTLGVAQYRAGEWQAAVTTLEKSMGLRTGGSGHDWFFLAMAHWHLGGKNEARKWYDKAVARMEKHKQNNDELRRFRAEAAELLGIEKKKD